MLSPQEIIHWKALYLTSTSTLYMNNKNILFDCIDKYKLMTFAMENKKRTCLNKLLLIIYTLKVFSFILFNLLNKYKYIYIFFINAINKKYFQWKINNNAYYVIKEFS